MKKKDFLDLFRLYDIAGPFKQYETGKLGKTTNQPLKRGIFQMIFVFSDRKIPETTEFLLLGNRKL